MSPRAASRRRSAGRIAATEKVFAKKHHQAVLRVAAKPGGGQVLLYLDDQIDVHALPTRGCCTTHALNEREQEFCGCVAPDIGGRKVVPVRIRQRAIEGVFGEVKIGNG